MDSTTPPGMLLSVLEPPTICSHSPPAPSYIAIGWTVVAETAYAKGLWANVALQTS